MTKQKYVNGVPQARPWVRFWARGFDIMIFTFIYINLLNLLGLTNTFLYFLDLFFYIFIEALLLSYFGTTPGKWFFRIDVSNKKQKLNYKLALKRSFLVLFKGMGVGIPILEDVFMLVAYYKLEKYGITSWDKELRIKISHQKIRYKRIILFILILLALFSWGVYTGRI